MTWPFVEHFISLCFGIICEVILSTYRSNNCPSPVNHLFTWQFVLPQHVVSYRCVLFCHHPFFRCNAFFPHVLHTFNYLLASINDRCWKLGWWYRLQLKPLQIFYGLFSLCICVLHDTLWGGQITSTQQYHFQDIHLFKICCNTLPPVSFSCAESCFLICITKVSWLTVILLYFVVYNLMPQCLLSLLGILFSHKLLI